MENCGISVSMCVYEKDNPDWFGRAVESILCQTVKPEEIVIVVDGPVSTELDAVIHRFDTQSGFNVIRLAENTGHGNARRVSLENCKNSLVALMDADDISENDRFEKQLEVFRADSTLSAVGGNISEFCGSEENTVGIRRVPQKDSEIKAYMKRRCPMNQVTVMFKKEDVVAAGGYLDWYCEEDYYLWIRMAIRSMKFANVDDILVRCRVGDDMYRRRGGKRYFKSEAALQKYMLKKGIIGFGRYFVNVTERFIVQVLLPNRLRSFVFRILARDSDKR